MLPHPHMLLSTTTQLNEKRPWYVFLQDKTNREIQLYWKYFWFWKTQRVRALDWQLLLNIQIRMFFRYTECWDAVVKIRLELTCTMWFSVMLELLLHLCCLWFWFSLFLQGWRQVSRVLTCVLCFFLSCTSIFFKPFPHLSHFSSSFLLCPCVNYISNNPKGISNKVWYIKWSIYCVC